MKMRHKILLILIVVCACVGCDQATKFIAKQQLAQSPPIDLMNGMIVLRYIENQGSFLGLGAKLSDTVRFWLFIVLAALMVVGMLGFTLTVQELNVAGITGAALIIGGGIGNLIDRITHQGAVVDFMNVGIGKVRTGIFNVADVALMAGIGVLLLAMYRPKSTD
ncbi:MAG: signal peptidase II [Anaerolineae bacterium]